MKCALTLFLSVTIVGLFTTSGIAEAKPKHVGEIISGIIKEVEPNGRFVVQLTSPKDIEQWGETLRLWTKANYTQYELDGKPSNFGEAIVVGRSVIVEHVRGAVPWCGVRKEIPRCGVDLPGPTPWCVVKFTEKEKPPVTDAKLKKLIDDLSSDDGQRRIAATKAIFDQGKAALGPLRKAGAKQVVPDGTINTRRIDMVYSLLEGLPKNRTARISGYMMDSFGLHLDGLTREDVVEMGRRHGFKLYDKFFDTLIEDGGPNCYINANADKSLEDVIKAILVSEPSVVSINLIYIEWQSA